MYQTQHWALGIGPRIRPTWSLPFCCLQYNREDTLKRLLFIQSLKVCTENCDGEGRGAFEVN